jgi:ubiquinone/menaquinone biosynthesis C-methylase UbiE
MNTDYYEVTEIAGTEVSQEQIERMCHRYYWAKDYCIDKDVLEVACGSGQGLGYLEKYAKSIEGGDYSEKILKTPQKYYGDSISIKQFDAHSLPYENNSKDVIIIFEAIYYLKSFDIFLKECNRVLRDRGLLLISSANKDLFDFNPSPYTYNYYGVTELSDILESNNFISTYFGDVSTKKVSFRQKIFRPIKAIAVKFNIVPKSMIAKKILKKFVFGSLLILPYEIKDNMIEYISPEIIDSKGPDKEFKVILCEAKLNKVKNETIRTDTANK